MRHLLTRDHALATFEKFRSAPGTPFEETHFLDYLLEEPNSVGAVRNSFTGLNRFNKFIDAIQLEFGVCFSQDDLEKAFSVDAFIDRVNALQASRRGSLASLKNQERAGAGWVPVAMLDVILMMVAVGFHKTPVVTVGVAVPAVLVTVVFAIFAIRHRRDLARLRGRIEAELPLSPPNNSLERSRDR